MRRARASSRGACRSYSSATASGRRSATRRTRSASESSRSAAAGTAAGSLPGGPTAGDVNTRERRNRRSLALLGMTGGGFASARDLWIPFASLALDRHGAVLVVHVDVDDLGLGHLHGVAARPRPLRLDQHLDGDRGAPDAQRLAVEADEVAHEHRLV